MSKPNCEEDIIINENGTAIKFKNGTLLQYGSFTRTTGTNSTKKTDVNIDIYYAPETENSFPIPFKDTNYAIFSNINSANPYPYMEVFLSKTNNSQYAVRFTSSLKSYSRIIDWFAVGRWK